MVRCGGAVILIIALALNTAYADLNVIADTGETQPIAPFLYDITLPNQADITAAVDKESDVLNQYSVTSDAASLSYPAKSDFTPGTVTKARIEAEHFASLPLFVIGNDATSVKWAQQNADYLKKLHAFGIITNVDTPDETQAVESKTGLTLTPMNLTGLGNLVGTSHYPFLIDKGWVVQ